MGRLLRFAWLAASVELAVGGLVWIAYSVLTHLAGLDFVGFWLDARIPRGRFYDLSAQAAAQAHSGQPFLPDLYPPFFELARSWIGLLDLDVAYLVWTLISAAVTVAALWLLVDAADLHGRARRDAWLVSLGFLPLWINLIQGQTVAFVLLGIAATFRFWPQSKAGVGIGLALIKPHEVALLVLLPVVRRRWSVVVGLAVAAALLAAVGVAGYGWSGTTGWVRDSLESLRHPAGAIARTNLGLAGWLGWMPSPWSDVTLVGLGLGALLAIRRLADRPALAASVTTSLVLAPHLNAHDYMLLLAPGMLLAGSLERESRRLGWAALVVAYLGVSAGPWFPLAAAVGALILLGAQLRDPARPFGERGRHALPATNAP